MEKLIDGIRINMTVKGSGDYVFLLQGWGTSIELYEGLIDIISEKYTVVAADFPGFGKSEEPPIPWGAAEYARFVIKLIGEFSPKKVILAGHSHGGRTIIKLMSEPLPFEVEKIILFGSSGILPKRSFYKKLKTRFYKLSRRILGVFNPGALERLRQKMGSEDYRNATPIMRQCLVKLVNEDITPLISNISCPALLIWGENDDQTPLSDGQLMEKLMPDAGLVILKNAGHYAFLEQAYTFNRVIRSFLKIGE